MKKAYSKPTVEMIVFDYREQVTASGGGASGGWGDNGGGASGGWGDNGGGASGGW